MYAPSLRLVLLAFEKGERVLLALFTDVRLILPRLRVVVFVIIPIFTSRRRLSFMVKVQYPC